MLNGFNMCSLVFLALAVIISYAANGAKPSNLSNNQTPLPTDCKQPSSNVTEVCDNALKKMETKLEKLIANKLETKLEKLTATCEDALKRVESKLEIISVQSNKTLLSVTSTSCKELYDVHKFTTSQVYTLKFGSQTIPVYCRMGDFGCGDGGWTLAMKIDGTKKTFHYDSHFWSNKNTYNFAGGRTGFDSQETKLPTYWNTAFSKICLGMKIGHKLRFVTINKYATSLYSLIADGQYRATSLGRNTWKKLIGPQASLNTNCNKEGFNAICGHTPHSKARIGITSSLPNSCVYCDSRIGFGTGGHHDDTNTCGNEATYSPDNGNKHIKAMGYILVQ